MPSDPLTRCVFEDNFNSRQLLNPGSALVVPLFERREPARWFGNMSRNELGYVRKLLAPKSSDQLPYTDRVLVPIHSLDPCPIGPLVESKQSLLFR